MKTLLTFSTTALLALTGCASVPKDAPDELKSASAAIDQADDNGAKDMVPKTMKQASAKLDHAVVLYKDAKAADPLDNSKLAQAKSEAVDAKKMADNANLLRTDVAAWDGGDLTAYVEMKDSPGALATARQQLQTLREGQQTAASGTAAPVEMTQPVAFFATDDATVSPAMSSTIDELVALLKQNTQLTVHLVGYADRRGPDQINDRLSADRATQVAKQLTDKGIEESRITIEHFGATKAVAKSSDSAGLQIDRRVDATVRAVAH